MKRKLLLVLAPVAALALVLAATAGATPPALPAIPVSDYGDSILSGLATGVSQVFPYAAVVTAFAIGVGLVRRWLGHRKATRI